MANVSRNQIHTAVYSILVACVVRHANLSVGARRGASAPLRCMRSAPGHALRPGPWCVLFVLAEPLLCGGRKCCLSRTCENKISIVRFGGRTPSWCEAVERDAFVVWHAITDELAECFACRAVGSFVVWHLRSVP